MRYKKMIYKVIPMILFVIQGCGSTPDSDLIIKAKLAMDRNDFISALNLLSSVKKSTDEVIELKAEAHAGLSGFRFFSVVDNLLSSKSIAPIELIFNLSDTGDSQKRSQINSALTILESSKSKNLWTGTIHLKYSFFEFYKASVILKEYIKTDGISGWNPCSEEELPSQALSEVIVSINKGIDSINASIQKERLTKVNEFASDVSQIGVQSNGEYKILTSQITAQEIKDFRSLINSNVVTRGAFCPQ